MSAPRTVQFVPPDLPGTTPSARATRDAHGDPDAGGGDFAPLSFSQERLWLLAQLGGDASAAYNEPMAFDLRGSLEQKPLIRALDLLTARHEALRTRFVPVGATVRQVVDAPGAGFPLTVEDLTGLPDADERLAQAQREVFAVPFALGEETLARGRLIRLGAQHHVLLLTVHHVVFDGASRTLLLRELSEAYTSFIRGESPSLPEPTWSYGDYARWQRQWMEGEEPAAHAAYWTDALAGAPAVISLPTDRPRPVEQDFHGSRVRVDIDEDLTTALRALADKGGVSLFTALLAGWSALLSLLSGQDDIVVGTPSANRRRGDVGGLMGFLVNTLALRADVSDSQTVLELLDGVRRRLRSGLAHVDLPFDRVVESVNPPRSPAHTPLFQTMVAWVPPMRGELTLPGVEAEVRDSGYAPAKFDLALALCDEGERITGEIDYATALFDRVTVERYARYLLRVLRQMAECPDARIADVSLLDAHEQRELLEVFSDGGVLEVTDAAPRGSVLDRFAAQVSDRPAQAAVVDGHTTLDYATLDRRSNRLAHALISRGVRPGDVVGLHAGRSAQFVVGVLAVLKAGAAYLPLDPGQPDERLAAMVADARPALVLTDGASRSGDQVRALPAGWEEVDAVEAKGLADDAPVVTADASALAYVIYTSGSTGRPKGVAVTHGSVVNLLDYWRQLMGDTPGEAASAWSSTGFDASVHETLMPLTTGAVLHLVPDELRGDPQALMGWLREHRVTQAFLPPSYITWIDEDPLRRLAGLSLSRLLTGVESLPEAALHRMREALPGLRICYGYGPTEATLYTTAHTEPRPREGKCPIGRPLPGTRLYLLDERMRPTPVGVAGEVFIGGASLAREYLNQPGLTDERFLPDPFLPGERVYRTGDMARWLPDGNAEYVGRRDDQLKLRGFRIEPGEVEATLLALPGVREAAVLADRDAPGGPRLVAGVGRGEGPSRTVHEWRTALAQRLPDYMIPAAFAEFGQLPLTRSGKVDRAAVLRAAADAQPAQVNTAAPRDPVEMALYRIWRKLLVHPAIGIGDDFFDLGGTSISAIKMAHAVQEEFGRALPVRDIMLHRTIERLGALLRQAPDSASDGPSRQPDHPGLVELRAGEGRQRVVFVHPAGGTAFCYLPLSAALAEGVGVLGLQAPGINAGESTLPSVEAMAEEYLRLVDPRPQESLVLCGLSFGGLIAYEMGRRLAETAYERVSLVLLDTRGTEDAAQRAAITSVGMDEFRQGLVRFNGMYPGIDDEQIERYLNVYNHHRAVVRDYEVPASAARVVFMQATGGEDGGEEQEAAALRAFWERRAGGGLAVEPVPCGHWDMLESKALPRVAQVINDELDRLTAPAAGSTGHAVPAVRSIAQEA